MTKQGWEFFYLDKTGKQDRDMHAVILGRAKNERPVIESIMQPIRERHRRRWQERRAIWKKVKAVSLAILARPVP